MLLARDVETCTVDVNGKATDFRTVVVKPYYHRDETTEAPEENDESDDEREQGYKTM